MHDKRKNPVAANDLDIQHALLALAQQSQLNHLHKAHLQPNDLLGQIASWQNTPWRIEKLGKSFAGRDIHLFTLGSGKISLFAWSQMHGDEPTATASLLDLIQFFIDGYQTDIVKALLATFTVNLLPMLNPDGAQLKTRENGQGIDINRDARALQSPEGQLLHRLLLKMKPDYAFNLHDQSRYYACGEAAEPVTLAYLCPPGDGRFHLTEARANAMALIAKLAQHFRHQGHTVARYSDDYSIRAFGDFASSIGSACILIESGQGYQDNHRQIGRKLTLHSLLLSMHWLAKNAVAQQSLAHYEQLPLNRSDGMVDVIIRHLSISAKPGTYHVDIGLNEDQHGRLRVSQIGDLAHLGGYTRFDAQGMQWLPGKIVLDDDPTKLSEIKSRRGIFSCELHVDYKRSLLLGSSGMPVAKMIVPCVDDIKLHHRLYGLITLHGKVMAALIDGHFIDLR